MNYTHNQHTSRIGWLYAVLGCIGLIASIALTVDIVRVTADPTYIPPCNINPLVGCVSVMSTDQASVLGFPNSIIGIAFFAMIATVGAAIVAGASMKKWFWWGLQAATAGSLVFVYWLAYQSIAVIGTLCPYCLVVWAVTIPLALYTKMHNVRSEYLSIPRSLRAFAERSMAYHWVWLVVLYGVIVVPAIIRFW